MRGRAGVAARRRRATARRHHDVADTTRGVVVDRRGVAHRVAARHRARRQGEHQGRCAAHVRRVGARNGHAAEGLARTQGVGQHQRLRQRSLAHYRGQRVGDRLARRHARAAGRVGRLAHGNARIDQWVRGRAGTGRIAARRDRAAAAAHDAVAHVAARVVVHRRGVDRRVRARRRAGRQREHQGRCSRRVRREATGVGHRGEALIARQHVGQHQVAHQRGIGHRHGQRVGDRLPGDDRRTRGRVRALGVADPRARDRGGRLCRRRGDRPAVGIVAARRRRVVHLAGDHVRGRHGVVYRAAARRLLRVQGARRAGDRAAQQRISDLDVRHLHVTGVGHPEPIRDRVALEIRAGGDDALLQRQLRVHADWRRHRVVVADWIVVDRVRAGRGGGVQHLPRARIERRHRVVHRTAARALARVQGRGRAGERTAQQRIVDLDVRHRHVARVGHDEGVGDHVTGLVGAGRADVLQQLDCRRHVQRRGHRVVVRDLVAVRIIARRGGGIRDLAVADVARRHAVGHRAAARALAGIQR